jgi:valyl-tRNA synthetase
LHPVAPFITEALWGETAEFGPARESLLIAAAWPDPPPEWIDPRADEEIGWLIELVSEVRSIRSEMNVPPSARAPLTLVGANAETRARLTRNRERLVSLARLDSVKEAPAAPAGAVLFVAGEATAALGIAEFIDLAAERARLAKEIKGLDDDIVRTARKLDNPEFMKKAPETVVEENRERMAEAQAAKTKLEGALARLAAIA